LIVEGELHKEDGNELGISQQSISHYNYNITHVWNLPFEIVLNSDSLFNWPNIILTFYAYDLLGHSVPIAYANTYIPTTPGITIKTLHIFSLKSKNTSIINLNP
jgi:hypothetical protein